jgi:CRISPR-associated protein Csb2
MLLAPPSADHHRFFQAARWLIGAELREQGGALVCRLGELPPTDPVVRCYRSTARCWSTVTPVILHGHNATKGNISIPKTVKLIRQALTEAGYPGQTALVEAFQAAPFWPNTASVHRVMVPSHLQGWPRYHVVVQFSSPVRGPVVAGLGRHYGIGLFAPMDG